MTERPQDNLADDAIKTLLQHGLGQGLPRMAEMLLNAAMCFECSNHLNADPYERAQARTGHANGFKLYVDDYFSLSIASRFWLPEGGGIIVVEH